ncbi:MAG TPA: caspase family protein [Spirochaetota bacterium]|nr:caspase family protein [Spirochaetota bacterium]HPS85255.1 caspase family protein [Spirochaetota bacterium]
MIKPGRIAIIILLIAAMPGIIKTAEAKNIRRFAVIVGANNGGDGRVMLRYAVSDADTMMNVLKSIGGVSDSDGLLLINPDRRNFISALNKIKNEINGSKLKNERIEFIFYYSGHSDDEAILLGREKIYYKELKEGIRGIPADVRIAILDSCSSGAFTRIKGGKFRPPFILDASFNMKGDAFMTSSSSNEASQESDAIKGSFFTYYLVSGLRGAADMIQDGRITLNEAYQYAYNETLARTEKTMGGTQHPNYDIQMTGTGDVVITDIKRKTSGLLLEKKIAGKIYIRNSDNILVAELQKPYGREMEVALPEGKYSLLNQIDNNIFETKINVLTDERYLLSLNSMTQTEAEKTVYRGDSDHEKKIDKQVILDINKIEHGGYLAVINQASKINGNWSDLVGGKVAWIINHSFSLGAGGYGLVYPTDRQEFTGAPYNGIDSEINFGFGGILVEYFFWPDSIFTLAPGIMVGGGALQYYPGDDNDDEHTNPTDSFFVVTPELNIYINVTEYVRIGAGVSYRMVKGIDQKDFSDSDISGFSFSLAAAVGFF